jgi:phage-related protein
MSANENYELAVRLRGEGIDETEDDLEGVEDQFDETAGNVGDSADEMQSFATRWRGAMKTVVAGLAVAAAGLLSQVPVVGGLMESLFAIIEAVAFQLDQVLRPILQPVADAFFELAGAIFEMEGPAGTIIGILAAIAVVAIPIAAVFGTVAAVIAGLVVGIILLLSELGLLEPLINIIKATLQATVAVLKRFADFITGPVAGALSTLADLFTDLISDAFDWGRDLILRFKDGILDVASAPVDAAQDVIDGIMGAIGFDLRRNDRMAERWGSDMLEHFSMGMEQGARLVDMNINASSGGSGGGGGGRPASRQQAPAVYLDGREVNNQQRRRRGRNRRARQRDGT